MNATHHMGSDMMRRFWSLRGPASPAVCDAPQAKKGPHHFFRSFLLGWKWTFGILINSMAVFVLATAAMLGLIIVAAWSMLVPALIAGAIIVTASLLLSGPGVA